MGNPLVSGNVVYASAGGVGFNFSNVVRDAKHGTGLRGGGISFSGIYALNRQNGRLLWRFATHGEAMPTPVLSGRHLFLSTGSGNIMALDAVNGNLLWRTHVGGIANMSAPVVVGGRIYVSVLVKPYLYCLDAHTGHVIWRAQIPRAANMGTGHVAPAASKNVVVMDAVTTPRGRAAKASMDTVVWGYDARTGRVLWTQRMGRGPKPPAFKGGMPMIHHDVVYVGTPVNSVYKAFHLQDGRELWSWHVPDAGSAGAGRGAATYYRGALYVSTGLTLYALDPATGRVIGHDHVGGRFGMVNPVIVGGTIYLANSWDWLIAVPVGDVNPAFHKQLATAP